jgi:Spy/CpxP family protein refolding chaperone
MLGLFVGTVCLIALMATLRARRYAHFMPAGGWYGHGCGARHYRFGHRSPVAGYWLHEAHGTRRGRFLFDLFRRLDATPGQEKAILKVAEEFRARLHASQRELDVARRDLAVALGGDELDNDAFDAAFLRNTELFVRFSREVQEALVSVHQTLDPAQRRVLSELVADGSFGPCLYGAHPYSC